MVVGIVAWLLWSLDWEAVKEGFGQVKPWLLLVLIGLLALNFVIRSWRWGLLLGAEKKIPLRALCEATVVGFMCNFLLPFRAGEVVRPWVLSRWESLPFGSTLASIVLERVIDSLVVIGFLAVSMSHLEERPEWLGAGAILLGMVALAGLAMMLAAYFLTDLFTSLIRRGLALVFRGRLMGLGAKLNHMLVGFIAGLRTIRSFRQLLVVLAASVLLWLELAFFYQVGLLTMGMLLPWWAGLTVMVLVALAVAAPGPPGFLGTFQIGCIAALSLYGVSKEATVSYSIVMHLLQALGVIAVGLWVLKSRGLSLKKTLSEVHASSSEQGT